MQNLLILLTIECFCLGNILFKQFVVWKSSVSIFGYIYIHIPNAREILNSRCKQKRLSSFSKAIVIRCSIFYINFIFYFFHFMIFIMELCTVMCGIWFILIGGLSMKIKIVFMHKIIAVSLAGHYNSSFNINKLNYFIIPMFVESLNP